MDYRRRETREFHTHRSSHGHRSYSRNRGRSTSRSHSHERRSRRRNHQQLYHAEPRRRRSHARDRSPSEARRSSRSRHGHHRHRDHDYYDHVYTPAVSPTRSPLPYNDNVVIVTPRPAQPIVQTTALAPTTRDYDGAIVYPAGDPGAYYAYPATTDPAAEAAHLAQRLRRFAAGRPVIMNYGTIVVPEHGAAAAAQSNPVVFNARGSTLVISNQASAAVPVVPVTTHGVPYGPYPYMTPVADSSAQLAAVAGRETRNVAMLARCLGCNRRRGVGHRGWCFDCEDDRRAGVQVVSTYS